LNASGPSFNAAEERGKKEKKIKIYSVPVFAGRVARRLLYPKHARKAGTSLSLSSLINISYC